MNIFKWSYWYKKDIKKENSKQKPEIHDNMEEALWEIKEEYDLETEEIDKIVLQKRRYAEIFNLRNKKN